MYSSKKRRELLVTLKKKLSLREIQQAQYGISTEPSIIIDIENLKAQIENLELAIRNQNELNSLALKYMNYITNFLARENNFQSFPEEVSRELNIFLSFFDHSLVKVSVLSTIQIFSIVHSDNLSLDEMQLLCDKFYSMCEQARNFAKQLGSPLLTRIYPGVNIDGILCFIFEHDYPDSLPEILNRSQTGAYMSGIFHPTSVYWIIDMKNKVFLKPISKSMQWVLHDTDIAKAIDTAFRTL